MEHILSLKNEINEIEQWFVSYDKKCTQYQRHIRTNDVSDIDINALDLEAINKANRLREIKQELSILWNVLQEE